MSRGLALLLVVAASACDLPLEAVSGGGPVVVGTDPPDGAVAVDRAGPFRVSFDRPILPRDVNRARLRIQSGSRTEFISAWLEPVRRTVVVELLGEPLLANVLYRLAVQQIRDLELQPMADHEIEFETGEAASPAPPRAVSWADVRPLLTRCGGPGCHSGEAPAVGLDLSSGEGVRETAIGVTARRSQLGTQGARPWHGVFTLDGLARIDAVGGVGRPGRSFLLYTLLDEGGAGHVTPIGFEPSTEELLLLSWWVRGGAPTE